MSDTESPHPTEVGSADMQRIRDKIDALEIASAEREKLWYKQAANLLSILAVVVSAGVVLYQTQFEARSKQLEELQQISVDLVETNKAMNEAAANQANAASASQIQSLLTTKATILLSRGIELAREYKRRIPPEIFFILGSQAESQGRYEDAQELFKKAIADNSSYTSQVDARRGLASLYMLPGTGVGSIAEGEQLLGEAIKYVEGRRDPYSLAERGFIYWVWGQAEFAHGDAGAGMEKLNMAENAYQTLPLTNPYRASGLQNVRQSRALLFQLSEAGHQAALRFTGQWTIVQNTQESGSPGFGILAALLDPDTGALNATCARTPPMASPTNPAIQMNGLIQVQDFRRAVFSWQGTARSWGPGESSFSGTTILTLSEDGTKLSAAEQRPNLPAVNYTLLKLRPQEGGTE